MFWLKDHIKRWLNLYKLNEVFTPNTVAKVTYVPRSSIEESFERNLGQVGRAIIIYGHSGSGKTTLIRNKLKQLKLNYVQISCDHQTSFIDILTRTVDELGTFYVTQRKTNRKYNISAKSKIEYNNLASELNSIIEHSSEITQLRMVNPQITPQRIAKLLGNVHAVLILEDFHKVSETEKEKIADCLKIFIDSANDYPDLKVICIGAVDTPRELVDQSADLYPRVSEIEVPLLTNAELNEAIEKGCEVLNIKMSSELKEKIIYYSNNLGSLAHKMCFDICFSNRINKRSFRKKVIGDDNFKQAIDSFIRSNSDSLKKVYDLSIQDKIGWYIIKTISNYGNPIRFEDLYSRIKSKDQQYDQIEVKNKLTELVSEEINILRFDKNSGMYSISTPFWGAFLKMKLATEKAQKNQSIKNKRNKKLNVKAINLEGLDAIVQASFLHLIEEYNKIHRK